MREKLVIILCLFSLFSIGCKSKKNLTEGSEYLYQLKRGACFGRCPVFELKIKEDGTAFLNATRFNPINGKLTKKLSKAEMDVLKKAFDDAKLKDLDNEYPTLIQDLPVTILSQTFKKEVKRVKGNEKMSDEYNKAVQLMEGIARSENWTVIEKFKEEEDINERPAKEPKIQDESLILDEIIIEPQPGVRLPVWFKEMENYSIRLIKKIDAPGNLWLITYDKTQYEPRFILDILKKDPNIKNAEFNKIVSNRN